MPGKLITHQQNEQLLHSLNDAEVRFFVVGGLAIHYHVPERVHADIDLLLEPSIENARKVIGVLDSFHLQHGVTVEGIFQPKKARIPVKVQGFDVDLVTPGVGMNFAAHFDGAIDAMFDSPSALMEVKVASIETLLLLLSESAEPRHREDIELLKRAQQGK
jgi:hypothetical protein